MFKYDLGQLVYYLKDNKVRYGKITTRIKYEIYEYNKYIIANCIELFEDEIFPSKEELAAHILSE